MARHVKETLMVWEICELLNQNLNWFIINYSPDNQQSKEVMPLIEEILGLPFFEEKNQGKDLLWLRTAIEREEMKLQLEEARTMCAYEHAQSIVDCVKKSLEDYRAMQSEWPAEELAEFKIQAKLADIQEQEGRAHEILHEIEVRKDELQRRGKLLFHLKLFLNDKMHFKEMEAENDG